MLIAYNSYIEALENEEEHIESPRSMDKTLVRVTLGEILINSLQSTRSELEEMTAILHEHEFQQLDRIIQNMIYRVQQGDRL